MADFLAGQKLTALHFPPTVSNTQTGTYTCTNTTFGVGTTGGTYVDCGVAFIAPITGRVRIDWSGQLANSIASAATELSPYVRTGGTVGAGTDVVTSSINNKLRSTAVANNSIEHLGASLYVSGLTSGSTYNVRLDHRVSGNTGSIASRTVTVSPAT